MKEENQFEVPFQVQTLIATLKDKKERVHVRGNYRQRLDVIRSTIDRAVREYDIEMGNIQDPNRHLKKGQK
jgi:3-dehydroquinate dehydratase